MFYNKMLSYKAVFSILSIPLVLLLMISPSISLASKTNANGIQMYFEIHGENNKNPIVLIAGFTGDHNFWSGVVQQLAREHQVLVFDNRGIGQTDTPNIEYFIDMMADDTMALINKLGIKQPTIIGQSMGSAIAQSIGRKYGSQVGKLVLINTFPKLNKAPEMAFEVIGELLPLNLPLALKVKSKASWAFSSKYLSNPQNVNELINQTRNNPYPQSSIGYQRQLSAIKAFDSRAWLKDIQNTTLIIAAAEDIIAPQANAIEVANWIGHQTKIVIIPGGHASPIEQPQRVIDEILKFITY